MAGAAAGLVAAVFAVAVLVVGGLRGARSLVALALTLTVVVKIVIPLLLRGSTRSWSRSESPPAVTLATLLLTEGFGRITIAATLGTLAALGLTALLGRAVHRGRPLHRAPGQ